MVVLLPCNRVGLQAAVLNFLRLLTDNWYCSCECGVQILHFFFCNTTFATIRLKFCKQKMNREGKGNTLYNESTKFSGKNTMGHPPLSPQQIPQTHKISQPYFLDLIGCWLVFIHNWCKEFLKKKMWFPLLRNWGLFWFFFPLAAFFLNSAFMFSIIALEVTFLDQSKIFKCVPHCQLSRLLSSAKWIIKAIKKPQPTFLCF